MSVHNAEKTLILQQVPTSLHSRRMKKLDFAAPHTLHSCREVPMTSYLLSLSIEDSRHLASYYEPIVEGQIPVLRAVLQDYFDDLSKLKEGDEFLIEIQMTEPELFRFWIFRCMREQEDFDVKGTYGGKPFHFHKRRKRRFIFGETKPRKPRKKGIIPDNAPPEPEERPEVWVQHMHERLFSGFAQEIMTGMEKTIAGKGDPVKGRWRVTKWILAGVSLAVVLIFYLLLSATSTFDSVSDYERKVLTWATPLLGLLTFAVGYSIAAAFMPLQFFTQLFEGRMLMFWMNKDDAESTRTSLRISIGLFVVIGVLLVIAFKMAFG